VRGEGCVLFNEPNLYTSKVKNSLEQAKHISSSFDAALSLLLFRMTVESILERINQKPFRPIALQTVDKTWIKVDREADIFLLDRMETACVVIFDPMRRKFVFTP
jgi:hypothetical protein